MEMDLDTILEAYTRGQRTSRWISLAVTALTIVVGTSLVFVAAATTASYYKASNEIDQLNVQIKDLNDKLTKVQKEKPKDGQKSPEPTKEPVHANSAVDNNTNVVAQNEPCNKETQSEQPNKYLDKIVQLENNINGLKKELEKCYNAKPKPTGMRPGVNIVKKPVVVQ